jgi:hypothetical protein
VTRPSEWSEASVADHTLDASRYITDALATTNSPPAFAPTGPVSSTDPLRGGAGQQRDRGGVVRRDGDEVRLTVAVDLVDAHD